MDKAERRARAVERAPELLRRLVESRANACDDAPTTVTPMEVILRATVGDISRETMLNDLMAYPYTDTQYAPYPFDGSIPGTWNDVCAAALTGLITNHEFERISVAAQRRSGG